MAGILAVGNLKVETDIGQCQIQLCIGDITALPKQDRVDVLVISAFPGDYSPTPSSLIGQLLRQLAVNVRHLSQDKEEDLRSLYSCWWSKPLPDHLSFKKILCFEGSFRKGKKTGEVVGDIFRCLVSVLANKEGTVIMPLLATGDQRYSKTKMLKLLINAAVHWMKAGLPLRCLKIVLFSRDISKISKADAPLIKLFEELKEVHETEKEKENPEANLAAYDIYLSYSEDDKNRIHDIVESLKKNKAELRIFSSIQELDTEESWQEKLYGTIIKCQRVMALITPSYLQSSRCTEQYNIALCHSRKIHQSILVPLYVSEVPHMPTYMKLTQYIDCRIDFTEKVNVACVTVLSYLTVTPLQTETQESEVAIQSSTPENYDVFLSYSHCNEEIAKQILNELQRKHPSINIFIDTAELKAGGAWQQTLYHALDHSKIVITLISNDYLCSKVCCEELSLSIAVQQQGQCKVVPIIIEQIQEVKWLRSLSPLNCFESTTETKKVSITDVCEGVIHELKEPSSESGNTESLKSLSCLSEEFRILLFQREYAIEPLLVSSTTCNVGNAQPTPVVHDKQEENTSNNLVYIINCPEDSNYCQLLMRLIHAQNPSLVIKTTSDGNNSDRLNFLDEARFIIPLLSASFTEHSELIHELNISWCRQRSSPILCFLAITIDELPDQPTYLHLLPSFFNCGDKRWEEKAALELIEANELTKIFTSCQCPLRVVLCFIAAVKHLHQWLQEEDCFVISSYNKFFNLLFIDMCLQHMEELSINDTTESNEANGRAATKDETVPTTSQSNSIMRTVEPASIVPEERSDEAISIIEKTTDNFIQRRQKSSTCLQNMKEISMNDTNRECNEADGGAGTKDETVATMSQSNSAMRSVEAPTIAPEQRSEEAISINENTDNSVKPRRSANSGMCLLI